MFDVYGFAFSTITSACLHRHELAILKLTDFLWLVLRDFIID